MLCVGVYCLALKQLDPSRITWCNSRYMMPFRMPSLEQQIKKEGKFSGPWRINELVILILPFPHLSPVACSFGSWKVDFVSEQSQSTFFVCHPKCFMCTLSIGPCRFSGMNIHHKAYHFLSANFILEKYKWSMENEVYGTDVSFPPGVRICII